MTSLGLNFAKDGFSSFKSAPGLQDLRHFISSDVPNYDQRRENHYRNSLKKSREETFDENKQAVFFSDSEHSRTSSESSTRLEVDYNNVFVQTEVLLVSKFVQTIHVPIQSDEVKDFDDSFSLQDEASWSSVPELHLRSRFAQYRALSNKAIQELNDKAKLLEKSEQEKRLALNNRFTRIENQWNSERQAMEATLQDIEEKKKNAQEQAELALQKMQEMVKIAQSAHSSSTEEEENLQMKVKSLELAKMELEGRLDSSNHEIKVLETLLRKSEKEVQNHMAGANSGNQPPNNDQLNAENTSKITTHLRTASGDTEDLPFPDDISDLSSPQDHIADHPIVEEFMRCYNHVLTALQNLKDSLQGKGTLEISEQISKNLASLDDCNINRHTKVTPQIKNIGRNLTFVIDQLFLVLENMTLKVAAEVPVSSTNTTIQREAVSNDAYKSLATDMENLQKKYESLQAQFESTTSDLQSQLDEKDSTLCKLQSTISDFRREIERLRCEQQIPLTGTLMFTRLDADRNTKSLKQARIANRLSEETYQNSMNQMYEYSTVPARRLMAMSFRLMQIEREEIVRISCTNDSRFVQRIDAYYQKSTNRYVQLMDFLREERLRLANQLTDTLNTVESECSIFLIKPVLSLKYKMNLERHYRCVLELRKKKEAEEKRLKTIEEQKQNDVAGSNGHGSEDMLSVKSISKQPNEITEVWSLSASVDMSKLPPQFDRSLLNTPRLLEMDVSKVLLGQNRVSSQVSQTNENLRYYIPMNRHSFDTFPNSHEKVPPHTPYPENVSRNTSLVLPPIKAKSDV